MVAFTVFPCRLYFNLMYQLIYFVPTLTKVYVLNRNQFESFFCNPEYASMLGGWWISSCLAHCFSSSWYFFSSAYCYVFPSQVLLLQFLRQGYIFYKQIPPVIFSGPRLEELPL